VKFDFLEQKGGAKMDYGYEAHGGDSMIWIFLILILIFFTGNLGGDQY
jgi:hypothetical protein